MTTTTPERSLAPGSPQPIPFGRLLRVEAYKTVDTRAARWLLAASGVAILAGLGVALAFTHDITQSRTSYLSASALGLTRCTPILLLMALTGEWSQRTAMVTFTQEPRRLRVLAAKVLAGVCLACVLAVAGWVATEVTVAVARASGRHVTSDLGHDWPRLIGYATFVLLISLIGVAFGALVQNTAAAIVSFFAVGGLANLFSVGALRKVGHWVNTGETYGWVLQGEWGGHGAQIAVSSLLWIGVPLVFGAWRTVRREVR